MPRVKKQTWEGSQPVYGIKKEKNVYVPMRDGVRLAVDIYRPDAKGKFPALLALSPYGKELQAPPIMPVPAGTPLMCGGAEAGDTEFLVSRGYVHVIGDVRGTCKSEGEWRGWVSKQEAEDGHDLIEWIAQQPWCDGNVGMLGISYFGGVQLPIAAEQPPHLKAIFPYDCPADVYRDLAYPGGILSTFLYTTYIRPGAGKIVTAETLSPEELRRRLDEVRSNPDVIMYPPIRSKAENPRGAPCFVDILLNSADGPFYWERSAYVKYDRIKIPAYTGSGWYAYGYCHLPGAFKNYMGLKSPKKMIITPAAFLDRPWYQYHDLILRWFDHWLKGIDTGIMDEPPIKIFVMGANEWRYENEWPLARTEWTKFYLRGWERLSPEPETFYTEPDCYVQQPLSMTTNISSVKYMTPSLTEDVEITGPIALYLHAAIDQEDTNWIVALRDVAPDGSEIELTRGWLKASHRAVDESKSEPWRPWHPHTNPEPVVPGEIYEYPIEIVSTSNVFKFGHRIKLEIMSLDYPGSTPLRPGLYPRIFPNHMCSSKTTLHKIYRDREHQSYLLLPIIPKT